MHSQSKTPAKNPTGGWSSDLTAPGNLLEVVVITTTEGTQFAIHAMTMRAKFRRLRSQ
jgi:hypothetical protein